MGGIGSGRRWRPSKHDRTDDAYPLDIRRLNRAGALRPGSSVSWCWTLNDRELATIGLMSTAGHLVLRYRWRPNGGDWEDVIQSVDIQYTACNYGGKRPWFRCPAQGCGRRVAVIYGPGRYFACRHCYQLRYESQVESASDRAMRRARKIRRRLGGGVDMTEPFPWKPKRMRWETYSRLHAQSADLERLSWVLFADRLRRVKLDC